jgi:cysteine desulfurase
LAIHLALQSTPHQKKKHIVTSNVEHPAIEACLRALQEQGLVDEVTYVPVGTDGRVEAKDMCHAIRENTVLVTLMLANNESGALQPVQAVAQHCRAKGILFHTDAAQAMGKIPITLSSMGYPDMVTLVGHKIGAPKGVAALYVRQDCLTEHHRTLPPSYGNGGILLIGGGQEGGRRAGTENVPYIVGMGRAAELLGTKNTDSGGVVMVQLEANAAHMEAMRRRLLQNLTSQLGGSHQVKPNGPSDPAHRLPNTLSVGLRNVHSGQLLANIGHEVAASAGAACHSNDEDSISAVLRAMKVPMEFAAGTLRLSVGPSTTKEDIDQAADIICQEAKRQLSNNQK